MSLCNLAKVAGFVENERDATSATRADFAGVVGTRVGRAKIDRVVRVRRAVVVVMRVAVARQR